MRESIVCAGCGLLCDDVVVERSRDAIRLQPDCFLGAAWFSERVQLAPNAPPATIAGQPADVETALRRAGELLRAARRPLVYGFDEATIEDARAALALADRLGALVAPGALDSDWPGAPAVPLRGSSTATLGEIRDRSGVVVIWREDPEATHPRLLDRLGFGGDERFPRTLVVVDDRDTATARRADLQLRWPRERDLEALSSLHVMQRALGRRADELGAALGELLERLDAVSHAALVHGAGLAAGAGGERRRLALHELVRELSQSRHVVTLELPVATGTRGAQDVLAWQTGYAESVDLAPGHPRLVTGTEPLLSAEGVDVALCIERAGDVLSEEVAAIALCSTLVTGTEVSIRTAAAGVESGGTAHRLDGIPLTLDAPLPGEAPAAATVLERLLEGVGAAR